MANDAPATGGAPSTVTTDTNSNPSAAATVATTAGEQAKASQKEISGSSSVPSAMGQQPADPNAADFRTGWDDTLKNDPTLKDFKDTASIAKALVETKKLVGQKLGIPGKDATPEAKSAFYEALGVPKEPTGYGFDKPPEDLPAALKEHYDQAHADKWAGLFKEHNVPAETAKALRAELFKEMGEEVAGMQSAVETSDAQFKEMAVGIFGDEAKTTKALEGARVVIERHLPQNLKAALNQLPNTALLAVAAAISGEMKGLTGEDKTISRDNGTVNDGKTIDQIRQENREYMKDPAYNSPFTSKGKEEHERLNKLVKDNYARISQMGGK